MSGIRGVMKEGWHPKGKSGGKESWRGDFKGINQVAGWMGKGKDKDSEREQHVSRPLSSLKDPAAFGPPPKHIGAHGPAAVPDQTTPDRRGLGAPFSEGEIQHQQQEQERAEEQESQKAAAPPLPYRANTTGLNTDRLPPPPVRRIQSLANSVSSGNSRPVPSVPPRIPPRMDSTASSHPATPPPAYSPSEPASEGLLNQGAVSRLSNAGVSVPALGIGQDRNGPGSVSRTTTGPAGQVPVSELQARFSQMRTTLSNSPQAPSPPVRRDTNHSGMSPVTGSRAQDATATANNFREQHHDKIQAGKERMHDFNDKYKITQRFNNFVDEKKSANTSISSKQFRPPPAPPHPNRSQSSSDSTDIEALAKRKSPPPPPPPKKAAMRSMPVNAPSPSSPVPPPLPLSTKPR